MRELITQIEIKAPPAKVWEVLTAFSNYPEWSSFIKEVKGEPQVSSTLKTLLEPPGGKPIRFAPVVIRSEAPHHFRWRGKLWGMGFLFKGEHYFQVQEVVTGTSLLTHGELFSGILLPLIWQDLNTKTRAGFEQFNQALKKQCEG